MKSRKKHLKGRDEREPYSLLDVFALLTYHCDASVIYVHCYSFSAGNPAKAEEFNYEVTCAGIEIGSASLIRGDNLKTSSLNTRRKIFGADINVWCALGKISSGKFEYAERNGGENNSLVVLEKDITLFPVYEELERIAKNPGVDSDLIKTGMPMIFGGDTLLVKADKPEETENGQTRLRLYNHQNGEETPVYVGGNKIKHLYVYFENRKIEQIEAEVKAWNLHAKLNID